MMTGPLPSDPTAGRLLSSTSADPLPSATATEGSPRSDSVHYRSAPSFPFQIDSGQRRTATASKTTTTARNLPNAGLVVTDLLRLRIALDRTERLEDACQVLAESLCNILTCPNSFVSVARGKRLVLWGQEREPACHVSPEDVLAAQQEISSRQSRMGWPGTEHCPPSLIHKQLTSDLHPAAVSFVMRNRQGERFGVVTLIGDRSTCALAAEKIGSLLDLVTPHLQLRQQACQSLTERIQLSWKTALHPILKWTAIIGLLLAMLLLRIPMRIHSPTEAQPVLRRFVAAPFESVLQSSLVRAGDIVSAGDPLARLDGDEIRLRLSSVEAEKAKYWKQKNAALAEGDTLTMQQAQLEYHRLSLQQELLQQRGQNLEITSPISGVVLTDELHEAAGAPLSQGQVLFEIAPLNRINFWIYISQQDIAYVQQGQSVQIRGDAWQKPLVGTIQRIRPEAILHDNQSVFVAEVSFDNQHAAVRPGMRGYAIIQSHHQSIGWILFRKPLGYLRRFLGF